MPIALYPGSFDPITNGHIDIAQRAAVLFDKLIVAVYSRPMKNLMFSAQERLEMVRTALEDFPSIEVKFYNTLTVDFAQQQGAQVIVRGLRAISDFEMEFQMALTNRQLAPDVDMICLMTSQEHAFLSSSVVKEIAWLNGDITTMVPAHVAQALSEKVKQKTWQPSVVITQGGD